MKKIDVLMTAFRDGIQSAYGARILSKDHMPVIEAASRARMVGIEPQSGEIIALYSSPLKRHGINAVRNFDALNDTYNLAETGRLIAGAGLKHEPAICVTDPPPGSALEGVDTPEYYKSLLVKFLETDLPFNSVCFKDSVGTVRPSKVHETVKLARKLLGNDISISWHTHTRWAWASRPTWPPCRPGRTASTFPSRPCREAPVSRTSSHSGIPSGAASSS